MEPKPCRYCGATMFPTRKHYEHQWAEKKFCNKVCKDKAAVESRALQRAKSESAAERIKRANFSRIEAMKEIARLLRIPWTKAWWQS